MIDRSHVLKQLNAEVRCIEQISNKLEPWLCTIRSVTNGKTIVQARGLSEDLAQTAAFEAASKLEGIQPEQLNDAELADVRFAAIERRLAVLESKTGVPVAPANKSGRKPKVAALDAEGKDKPEKSDGVDDDGDPIPAE